jgi:hypothetical protein
MASSLSDSSYVQSSLKVKPEDFTKLDPTTCGRVWHKWKGKYSLDGIEIGCFKNALLAVYSHLFSSEEQDEIYKSSSRSDLFKPIWSALQRLGGPVLSVVYDTIMKTAESSGAQQHRNIADSLLQCANDVHLEETSIPTIKPDRTSSLRYKTGPAIGKESASCEPQNFHGGRAESDCQLLKAEVSHVVAPPGIHVHHGESGYQSARSHVDDSKQEVANPCDNSLSSQEREQPSQEQGEEIPWDTKEYVAEFTDFLVSTMPPNHVTTLANELIDDSPGQRHNQIKQQIRSAVLNKNLSLYDIAKCLLGRNQLRQYIFKIAEYTKAPITSKIVDAIVPNIGSDWQQFASTMGMMGRTAIDSIVAKKGDVPSRIRECFEEGHKFPRFPVFKDNLSFLVEVFEKASLPQVAQDVCSEFSKRFRYNFEDIHPESRSYCQEISTVKEIMDGNGDQDDYTAATKSTSKPSIRGTTEVNLLTSSVVKPVHQADSQPDHSLEAINSQSGRSKVPPPGKELEYTEDELEMCERGVNQEELVEWVKDWSEQKIFLVRRKDKKQPVHFAAELGYVRMLKVLIKAGYNGRAVMAGGKTPFLLGCESGMLDVVKELFCIYGHSVLNERDECERMCLHFPEVYRNKELFSYLLWDLGANVKATSVSLFHIYVFKYSARCIQRP